MLTNIHYFAMSNNSTDYLEILKKANAGDPESIRIISNICPDDLKKIVNENIIKYIKETSNLSYSAYFLGSMYINGIKVEQNYQKAVELYEKAIELGNNNAMNDLGYMYTHGEGVEQNSLKAIKLYEKGIENGNSNSMNNLALLYHIGRYVEKNYQKARELYEKAVELMHKDAMDNLASMYCVGEGVEQNYPKAMELYKKAIELGNTNSMNNLGCMYQDAYGTEQNYPKAIELFEKSAELGNSNGMSFLEYLLKKQNMLIELAELYLKHGKKEQFTETINKIFSRTDYKQDNIKLINLVTKDNIEDSFDKKIISPALLYLINYLNIHLKYSIGGKGFNECHEHFIGLCNNNSKKVDF